MERIHAVLGDNENTDWLVKRLLERDDGIVVVIDQKYEGLFRKGEVTYANSDYIMNIADLPIKFLFYAYMDPKNRKKE